MSEKYISRSTAVVSRLLGGEMVIMSAEDSTLFTLSEVATVIWEAADGCTPLSALVERLVCSEFDIALATAYRDAEAFVEELATHGILLVSDEPVRDVVPGAPEAL